MSKVVKLRASDGHELDAYVAQPEGKPRAGLAVVQEIFGVNKHIRSVADRFAREGFFAVAPALFDRVERNVDWGYDGESARKGMAIVQKIRHRQLAEGCGCGVAICRQRDGETAGVVGYCYGGTLAWLSATRLAPAAVVGYYGGHIASFAQENPRVPVMLHFGKQDDHIPATDVAKVQEAHPDVEIYWYDAGHGFNCDMRGSYNEKAAKEALARTLEFFNKHL